MSHPDEEPRQFAARNGTFKEGNKTYHIFFRGQPRRIGDLTMEELQAALMDAHCDLDLAWMKIMKTDVRLEIRIENRPDLARELSDLVELVQSVEHVTHRHLVSREIDEECAGFHDMAKPCKHPPDPDPKDEVEFDAHEWVLGGMNGMESVDFVWKCSHCGGTQTNQSETEPPPMGRCVPNE
jgi:hypothetical protein